MAVFRQQAANFRQQWGSDSPSATVPPHQLPYFKQLAAHPRLAPSLLCYSSPELIAPAIKQVKAYAA
jgi:hypothetical protein